mgnify:CR=1 FL=1
MSLFTVVNDRLPDGIHRCACKLIEETKAVSSIGGDAQKVGHSGIKIGQGIDLISFTFGRYF